MLKTIPPTSSLPSLARLSSHSPNLISSALSNLRALYFPTPPQKVILPKGRLDHQIYDSSFPDSGYTSAEEDELEVEEEVILTLMICENSSDTEDIDILRSDTFECEFAIK